MRIRADGPAVADVRSAEIKAAGYSPWTGVGEVYTVPLTLTVWARSAEPSFLFDLEGAGHTQTVYAAALPDAFTLLNQLAPTVQALAVTDQIARAEPETMSVLADVLDKVHDRQRDKNGRLRRDRS
ncbi:hypothetical protein ACFXPM_30940 [Streptomyces sp. NPDC059095]|uniref:hypothetical protein n=1 Tax=Streptomyces sp. NPDC059095 TaxID=3346726 RepID=UPI00367918C7